MWLCPLEEHERFLGYLASIAWVVAEAPEDLRLGEDFWSEIHHQASDTQRKLKKLSAAIEACDEATVLAIAAKLHAVDVTDAKHALKVLTGT